MICRTCYETETSEILILERESGTVRIIPADSAGRPKPITMENLDGYLADKTNEGWSIKRVRGEWMPAVENQDGWSFPRRREVALLSR